MAEPHTHGGTDAPECTTCRPMLDPAHVEAVALSMEGVVVEDGRRRLPMLVERAERLLTSTDPAVHAALLAALVRAGVLTREVEQAWMPGAGGPNVRRYATRWEDVDA